jgi:hypothetical protein
MPASGNKLKDLAEPVDLVVVGPVRNVVLLFDLQFHELTRIAVAGNIADGKINPFLDDQFVATDIRHEYPVLLFNYARAFIFALNGVQKDAIGLFRKRKEGELGIVEETVDKVELEKHLLTKKLRTIEKDLVILEVIDILHLEGGHPDLPDYPPGCGAKLDIMRRDQGLGQIRSMMLLG